MSHEPEKTLEQVLRETPWSAILIPLALGLLVILFVLAPILFGVAVISN